MAWQNESQTAASTSATGKRRFKVLKRRLGTVTSRCKKTPGEKSRFQVIQLEERIAPGKKLNHNERLVREGRFKIVALEKRIAPGKLLNHNEKLVRERN